MSSTCGGNASQLVVIGVFAGQRQALRQWMVLHLGFDQRLLPEEFVGNTAVLAPPQGSSDQAWHLPLFATPWGDSSRCRSSLLRNFA